MALQARSDMELWDRPFQTMLIAVLAVNVLGHTFNVPWWVLVASGIALAWKTGHLYFGWRLPPKRGLYGAGAIVGGCILWEYQTMLGHEAATPVLVFLASLKLLETNRDRDAKFIIVTSYFLLMAHLLHSQSLGSTFFMAFDVAIITILMFQLHRTDRRVNSQSLRPVVRLLILTIPIWLCLFVVFPRFSMRLFRTNAQAQSTGFSEGLDPGSVSSLAQSDEVAFRVKFKSDKRRNPETLYWRGATLYDGDGLKWTPRAETQTRQFSREAATIAAPSEGDLVSYDVITEAGRGLAIFTLPRMVGFQPGDGMDFLKPFATSDGLVRLTTPKRDHISYSAIAQSENQAEIESLSPEIYRRTLVAPTQTSAEYYALVDKLGDGIRNPHEAMAKLDEWFMDSDFRYTLSPGEAKGTSLEDFLFRNKKGFCEHFAATSASLLRSMGYNARVVVGYQGGKWNAVSNALIVRSRDAHAWVEVWSPSKASITKGRWVTYDPTASIAPLRLRLGGDFLDLPEEQQQQRDGVEAERTLDRLSQNLILKAIDRTVMLWDYAQMAWTQFLLGYDQSGQRNFLNLLLNWLGLTSRPWMMLGLVASFFAIMLRLVFLWHARSPREGVLKREWDHLAKELARIGAMRSRAEGPLTIQSRVQSEVIREGIDAFIELQYGSATDEREKLRVIRMARRAAKKIPTQSFVQAN